MFKPKVIRHEAMAAALALCLLLSMASAVEAGLVKVSDGVYSYLDAKDPSPSSSFGANAGIVVGSDGVLVVDTLISSKEAKRLIADIRAVTDKPIKYVVNTHCHLDHAFGNAEFEALGAVVIGQEGCKSYMEKYGPYALEHASDFGLKPEDMQGTVLYSPKVTFSDRVEIDLGGIKAVAISAGPSHVVGSVAVHIPAAKTLFAGDVLFTDMYPYMGDGDIKR